VADKQPFSIYNVVIGTAGHIDHGKSTVVTRLSGINPDRLPEEQAREMTIDIGFANFPLKNGQRVGIIDVPGHEDFIKNMLAGATGLDIVMLVISGVEGVMPQTIEHLRIMDVLGLKQGVVVINMVDIADPDTVELVIEDIKGLTQGTFLEKAPILKVSAKTGQGFDELYNVLNDMILKTPPREVAGVFRMPIQRIFSKKGFGTVITGVPMSGKLTAGETIEILPGNKKCRVKSMQAYGHPVEEAKAGHSSALNISDIPHEELHRGDVAATPGFFEASNFIEARFKFIPDTSRYMPESLKVLKSFMPIKFHAGTKEAEGKIIILDKPQLLPGDESFVQFRLEDPVVVAEGDAFIVRIATPTYTIGGGRVVDVSGQKLKRFKNQVLVRLEEKTETLEDRNAFVEFEIKDQGFKYTDTQEVLRSSKAPAQAVQEVVERLKSQNKLLFSPKGKFIHIDTFQKACDEIVLKVEEYHEKNPLRAGIGRLPLKQVMNMEDAIFERALEELGARKRLTVEHDKVHKPEFKPKMSKEDSEIAAQLEREYRDTKLASPKLDEIMPKLSKYSAARVQTVVSMLADQGVLVKLKDDVILHREAVEEAKRLVSDAIRKQGPLEPGKLRDVLGTSRKYLIPLLEHLDDIGLTVRVENKRRLREK
jgi:selenocysteine-specific elongation factor